jgi:hypothetical protein
MATSIDVEALDDEHEQRRDFRRANGAPLVSDPQDPDRSLRYSRPSSYAKVLDDEEALHQWRIWKAMQGMSESRALQIAVAGTKDDDRESKRELREKALDRGQANEKADQGTGLHAICARVDDESDDFDVPELFAADIQAYQTCLADFGLVPRLIEVHMVNDEWRAAGTADRVYEVTSPLVAPDGSTLPRGTLVLGDLKTGQKLDFALPGYTVQCAIYATSVLYDIHTERRLVTPVIDRSWALLVHMPVGRGRCDLLWVSIEIGLYGAWLAHEVKEWRRAWKTGRDMYDELPVPLPVDPVQILIEANEATDVTPDPEVFPDMLDYCKRRILTIGQNPDARKWLVLKWPNTLPKPKELTAPVDLVRLLDLLDAVEAQFSIPFQHTDPRLERGHRSGLDRSNGRGLIA